MFKKLFCKHDYEGRGFTYARCKKCDKQIRNPEIAQKKINDFCDGMVNAGHWQRKYVDIQKKKHGI
jgi:hypothetical protein